MLWDDQVREWKEEAREAGLSEGREEGIKEGRAAGIAEGEKRGKKENAIETAQNLLKMGLGSPEQISAATNLSIEEVLEIKQKLE